MAVATNLCALCAKELTGKQRKFCSTACTRELLRGIRAAARGPVPGRPKVLRAERRVVHGQEVDVQIVEAAKSYDTDVEDGEAA